MKKIICQLWKRRNLVDGRNVVERYSLHLNEKQRLIFLNKNLPRLSGSNNDLSVQHYFCEVDEEVYDEVIKKQVKHGLMIEGGSPPADIRDKCSWEWFTPPGEVTVQFSNLKKMLVELSLQKIDDFEEDF